MGGIGAGSITTTPNHPKGRVREILGVVTAECVFGVAFDHGRIGKGMVILVVSGTAVRIGR